MFRFHHDRQNRRSRVRKRASGDNLQVALKETVDALPKILFYNGKRGEPMNRTLSTIFFSFVLLLTVQSQAAILVFEPGGTYSTQATLDAAATDGAVAGKTVVVTSALSAAESNCSSGAWPADRALKVEKGGSIGNTTTLTINSSFSAPVVQVFAGSGTVIFGKIPPVIHPEWWGVTGTADDVAIQKAINSVGDTTTIRGGKIALTQGYDVANTILVYNKSIELEGLGFGNKQNSVPTYLRWTGSAGQPLVKIQSSRGVKLRNLRLIGNTTNKPSAAIDFFVNNHSYGGEADISQNSFNVIENVWIGAYDGLDTAQSGGSTDFQFTNGILYDGDNTGNNYDKFSNVRISLCNVGVNESSNMFGNNVYVGLNVTFCPIGVQTYCPISGSNWFFDNNSTADLSIQGDGRINLTEFSSERSARLANIPCGRLTIHGGSFSRNSVTFGGTIVDGTGGDPVVLSLYDFSLQNDGSQPYTGTPLFSFTSSNDSSVKSFTGRNIRGMTPAMLNMNPNGGNQLQNVFVDVEVIGDSSNPSYFIRNTIGPTAYGSTDTVDATRHDMPVNLNLKQALLLGKQTALANTATPSVADGGWFYGYNRTVNPITQFTNGKLGQIIVIQNNAGTLKIANNANIHMNSRTTLVGGNMVLSVGDTAMFMQNSSNHWMQL